MDFKKINDAVFVLRVPFEKIYTSIFLLKNQHGCMLVDGAASADDVKRYVIPALERLKAFPSAVIRSHSHHDHSGGVDFLAAYFKAKIGLCEDGFPNDGRYFKICDGDVLLERFEILNLRGHCDEGIAIYDRMTKTLLSFDCLQAEGLEGYGVNINDREKYRLSVERLKKMDIESVIASHSFLPFGAQVNGRSEVCKLLSACK